MHTPFQLGMGTKDHFFEWISGDPERLTNFQLHLAGKSAAWRKYLDDPGFVQQNLVDGAKTEEGAIFLVDVGGGKGHDLQELAEKHPDLPGRLVLQDLKGPVEEARSSKLHKNIELMEHDFFTEQPLKGKSAEG